METTNKLMHDLSNAEGNTSKIESNVKALDCELQKIGSDLKVSKDVNDSLHTLDDALTTTSRLLGIVKIIPSISESASTLKKSIDSYHVPVSKAVKASDDLEKVVKPVRDKIEEYEPKIAKADNVLLGTMNTENSVVDIIGSAQHCINSLPDSSLKSQLDGELDGCASELDPVVLRFDKIQITLLKAIEDAKSRADQIESWINNLLTLKSDIKKVLDILSPLMDSLQVIADAFKQTIRVPYGGYPKICKKWGVPYVCGWHTVYYSFTIQQIFDGINGVIQPVMDLLNDAMYGILNPILKKLHLNISLPNIPGLDILETVENGLPDIFKGIADTLESLLSGLQAFDAFVQTLQDFLSRISSINNECHLNIEKQ